MPKVNLHKVDYSKGRYPEAISKYTKGITDQIYSARVGELAGLTQFGVNKTILFPLSQAVQLRYLCSTFHYFELEKGYVLKFQD